MSNIEDLVHACSALPKIGVDIVFSDDGPSWAWRLLIAKSATEQDLEQNHCLEQVGETIWQTALEISHCPYCGKQLDQTCEGNFYHVDYSSW